MMCRFVIIVLSFIVASPASPSIYRMLKLPADNKPGIDGNISEWPEAYFLDSIRSDDNVYARDGIVPWTPAEFQMKLYGAYDDDYIYYAVKVTADDDYIVGQGWSADNLKINPGGQAMTFYMNTDGSSTIGVPSELSFLYGPTIWYKTISRCEDNLPSHEIKQERSVYDPFEMGSFQSSIGTEEVDSGNRMFFIGIGAEYTGPKSDWNNNPWDNPLYYPTFNLSEETGPPLLPFSNGSTYSVLKLPKGSVPFIDGDLADWPQEYFIDSLRSEDNVLSRSDSLSWTRDDFQMRVYAAYDDQKVYFALKVIADDDYLMGSYGFDGASINPGGVTMCSDGSRPYILRYSPFTLDTSLWCASKPYGNISLPTYETALTRSVYQPFVDGQFHSFIGISDSDSNRHWCSPAIGLKYYGDKVNGNHDATAITLPTFILSPVIGPTIAVEKAQGIKDTVEPGLLGYSPNPCNPGTTIRFYVPAEKSAKSRVSIKVYGLDGRMLRIVSDDFMQAGSHSTYFDGFTDNAIRLGSGIYICELKLPGFQQTVKIVVAR